MWIENVDGERRKLSVADLASKGVDVLISPNRCSMSEEAFADQR
jgi:hypothetical protein